jgi:hypothetical protein
MTRSVTWLLFIVCCPLAVLCVFLPLTYVLNAGDPHRSDSMIGWFWITVYGFGPAVLLAAATWLQRRELSRVTLGLWSFAVLCILISAAVMYGWNLES